MILVYFGYQFFNLFLKMKKNTFNILIFNKTHSGLDINVCPIPVKTDVVQVDLVSRLSDGTSEKMTVLPFEFYFL